MTQKKVFISYSWSSPAREQWVVDLAQRLISDGVDVILDKWDLKPGHDKYAFMEQMVQAQDIDKVLIILDKQYRDKANSRSGGVGSETLIISPNVYESTSQEKFIPIVVELDDEGKAYLPAYLKGRIYISLYAEEHFEAEYEKLLRNIFQRPLVSKPKLGTPPSYLFVDSPMNYKTTTMVRSFDAQLERHPERLNSLVRDFFDEYHDNLQAFKIEEVGRTYIEFGEKLLNAFSQFLPLRDDYIQFFGKVVKHDQGFDTDILIGFFEGLTGLLNAPEDAHQWRSESFEGLRLIIYELFLYTIVVSLKRENYIMLESLFHSKYFHQERYSPRNEPKGFTEFNYHVDSMNEFYKKQQGNDFLSCQADLIMKRLPDGFVKTDIVHADLLCYYVALLNKMHWFPKTYVYKGGYSNGFPIINRLVSVRHFEKIKGLLGVSSIQDFKNKVIAMGEEAERARGYSRSFEYIPGILTWVKLEQVATS